jgi:hypothetical protein
VGLNAAEECLSSQGLLLYFLSVRHLVEVREARARAQRQSLLEPSGLQLQRQRARVQEPAAQRDRIRRRRLRVRPARCGSQIWHASE